MVGGQRLIELISAHYGTRYQKVITCAPDVWEFLQAASKEKEERDPQRGLMFLGALASDLLAIPVTVNHSYRPGQWEMVRHDNCQVEGAEDPERATVTHERCTVIDREPGQ